MSQPTISYDHDSANHMVPGYVEAVQRLRANQGAAIPAFDSLELPFSGTDAGAMLDKTLRALVPGNTKKDTDQRRRLLGAMLLLAIVSVEADRKEQSGG